MKKQILRNKKKGLLLLLFKYYLIWILIWILIGILIGILFL
jgi:hypothetical protein